MMKYNYKLINLYLLFFILDSERKRERNRQFFIFKSNVDLKNKVFGALLPPFPQPDRTRHSKSIHLKCKFIKLNYCTVCYLSCGFKCIE